MIRNLLKFFKVPSESLDYVQLRVYESVPALMAWLTFIVCIALSIIVPIWGIYFIIVLDVYWVVKIWYLFTFLLNSWIRFLKAKKIDWKSRLLKLDNWEKYIHLIALPTYKEPYKVVKETFEKLIEVDYPKDKMIIVLGGEKG